MGQCIAPSHEPHRQYAIIQEPERNNTITSYLNEVFTILSKGEEKKKHHNFRQNDYQ